MIAFRILKHNHELKRHKGSGPSSATKGNPLTSALALVTESAAIYTVWTILFFATDERQNALEPFFNVTWASVSGFSAFLINMRVGLGWASTHTRLPTTSLATTIGFASDGTGQTTTQDLDRFQLSEFVTLGQGAQTDVRSESQSEMVHSVKKDLEGIV